MYWQSFSGEKLGNDGISGPEREQNKSVFKNVIARKKHSRREILWKVGLICFEKRRRDWVEKLIPTIRIEG